MTDAAEIYQFPVRHEDAQSLGPDSSQGPARSPQLEDGYTRIANELLEQVMSAPFTLREMRVVIAVVRLTYGWNRKQARITAGLLAKLTGMPATKASQTLAALIDKNVITRYGGSRSPISLNKHTDEWRLDTPVRVTPPPRQKGEINQIGCDDPKRYDSYQNGKSECYQNGNASKDMKDIPPLTSFEGEGAPPEIDSPPKSEITPIEKPRPKAKTTQLDLSDLPAGVTVEAVQGFIEHRKALKKPLTQRALNLNINEALRAAERIPNMTADQALDETVLAGWQGVKAQWLVNRIGANGAQPHHTTGRKGFAQPLPVGSYTPTDMDNLPDWTRG
nr:replication protein [uncultured Halomonas sp.]